MNEISYRAIFEATPVSLIIVLPDEEFTIQAVSNSFLEVVGTTREETIGKGIFKVFPDSDREGANGVTNLRTSLEVAKGQKISHTMNLQRYDTKKPGSDHFEERYWLTKSIPVSQNKRDSGSSPDAVDFIVIQTEEVTELVQLKKQQLTHSQLCKQLEDEILERKMTQDALLRSERKMKTYRSIAPVGIFKTDLDQGTCIFCNEYLTKMIGFDPTFQNFFDKICEQDRQRVFEEWRRYISSWTEHSSLFKSEFRLKKIKDAHQLRQSNINSEEDDENLCWALCQGTIESYEKNKEFVGSLTDITSLKVSERRRLEAIEKIEEEQRKRAEESEKYQQYTQRFTDTICHEIRNPLNGITGQAELLLDVLDSMENIVRANGHEPISSGTASPSSSSSSLSPETPSMPAESMIPETPSTPGVVISSPAAPSTPKATAEGTALSMPHLVSSAKECVEAILDCADLQKVIVNDVLDLSGLEANRIKVEIVPFSPTELVSSIIKTFRILAKNKHIDISFDNLGWSEQQSYRRHCHHHHHHHHHHHQQQQQQQQQQQHLQQRHNLSDVIVMSDPYRIKQILINFAINAIRYTRNGSIVFRLECERIAASSSRGESKEEADEEEEEEEEEEEGEVLMTFSVHDTGEGMSQEESAMLFKRFSRLESSSATRNIEGSGLGLSISKNLVELLGGHISFVSEKGKGTTFSFSIPCKQVRQDEKMIKGASEEDDASFLRQIQERISGTDENNSKSNNNNNNNIIINNNNVKQIEEEEEEVRKKKKNIRILVVDDCQINQMVLGSFLKQRKFQFDVAKDGAEAVEKWKVWHYEMIFMDLFMPVMNGIEAVKEIRRLENSNVENDGTSAAQLHPSSSQQRKKASFIVGLSGNAQEEYRSASLLAGMNRYITKPFKKKELYSLLDEYFLNELLILNG